MTEQGPTDFVPGDLAAMSADHTQYAVDQWWERAGQDMSENDVAGGER